MIRKKNKEFQLEVAKFYRLKTGEDASLVLKEYGSKMSILQV
jgi:hypothetical protein